METQEIEIDQGEEDCQETEFSMIPVQLVETYNNVTLASPTASNISLNKVKYYKYYKQTYRPAWEQMPDFKGWLRGVEGEPNRAYCTYCHKTLHAHRLSLLKHTCTIRHQKAAQLHKSKSRKIKSSGQLSPSKEELQTMMKDVKTEDSSMLEGVAAEESHENDSEHEIDDEEEEGDIEQDETQCMQKSSNQQEVAERSPISTHVIDTTRGKPVAGLQVSLYKLIDGRWTYINEGITNSNGRFSQFLEQCDFTPGRYKLHYDVDRYFESRKQESLYPFIEIVFDSTSTVFTETYHIPLMLSPYGYSTYKGS